ncbi:hypothetical protein [Dysgonomonas macrotermitis]|uniref:Uncharacterized protein n=1 Tax=Dysgonomonas macrotermitis TaxID=1346286 RepID=A0A1M5E4A7_9BACT|nr:hypothetical protein [Dysgonomonas macrotermitis]SHF74067.1 hypothetical protein SAMN05444362_109144 [Dysgonomonas macrotermitis]
MKHLKKKLRFYSLFLLTTLYQSIPTTFVIAVLLVIAGGWNDLQETIGFIILGFPTLGLAIAFFYKEQMRQNEYPFYYNATCGKTGLWVFTSICYVIIAIVLTQINKLIWVLI